jgi:hypothetical protein
MTILRFKTLVINGLRDTPHKLKPIKSIIWVKKEKKICYGSKTADLAIPSNFTWSPINHHIDEQYFVTTTVRRKTTS